MSTPATQHHGRRRPLAGLIVVLGLAALAILVWLVIQMIMAPPLSGKRHHDFGTILLSDVPTHTPAHIFKLKNKTGEPLMIRKVTASCGCTEITPYEKAIPADGYAEIPVRMSLKRSTREKADITITFEEASPMRLSVEAAARLVNPLIVEPRGLRMRPGETRPVTLAMEQWDDQPRLVPRIEPPDGIEVDVAPWKQVRAANDARGLPALERTTLKVTIPDDAESRETMIKAVLGEEVIRIPVVINSIKDYRLPEADQGSNRNKTFNPLHRGELRENFEDEDLDDPGANSSSIPSHRPDVFRVD
ncbi:MAG: hypothetical protein CMJ29_11115 [Phycisphaerae bacterium]|nr:hypothetical protein [Phycisphaerae bacterium]